VKELLRNLKRTAAEAMGYRPARPLAAQRVLFVCMGNICRSPTAEGVFRKLLAERAPELDVDVDSAGTHAYHVGQPPDQRSRRAALRRGVDLSDLRARKVVVEDFELFHLVLAMDEHNLELLHELCPPEHRERIRLFLGFAPHLGRTEVPDPYYGGSTGFEQVLDLVEEAGVGLLEHLKRTAPPRSSAAPSA
jgi:low molecular weight protein-tyrosine phosphatase